MTVAGLVFDDEVGPEGHSDGDVVAHTGVPGAHVDQL